MKETKMPRPGPRPYECVRRAWHSDRHQPIRGSLIKEIFRIANEVHSPQTKKNKEWQEKLPNVVLKAEEIMYSKANSEDEYMDPKTLLDRVNEAVDTIIRRDETTETGEFLQPCIEAALNLGCVPRRASRSQRNCNPGLYLSGNTRDSFHAFPINSMNTCPRNPHSTSPALYNYSAFLKPQTKHLQTDSQNHIILSGIHSTKGFSPPLKSPAVYPLYYGICPRTSDFGLPFESNAGDKEVKETRINASLCYEEQACFPHNLPEEKCDLSLRLAPLSVSARGENCESVQLGAARDSGFLAETRFKVPNIQKRKGFCLYSRGDTAPSLMGADDEDWNVASMSRKRKASDSADDQQCCWQSKHPCSYPTGGRRVSGV